MQEQPCFHRQYFGASGNHMQDTAAQVAAMTAELNRLADNMLPKEEEQKGKEGRKFKQDSQQHKDLRQRLVDSWDGKVLPCSRTM